MSDENTPVCAQSAPYSVDVEEQVSYWWCSCGRSETQPFCDESHEGTCFEPIEFTPTKKSTVYLCGCKSTKTPPFCDGSHKNL